MLFIGGTRDGQKLYVPWNRGNPVFKISTEKPVEAPVVIDFMSLSSANETKYEAEIYIKKEVWENKQYRFSVMVKDGSDDLLGIFLDKYNKKNKGYTKQ